MDSSIIAIISVFNEEDIIGQVIDDLVTQHVSVYVLDNGSTDRSPDEVARFVGRGVIGVERFPSDAGTNPGRYEWRRILERKTQLAQELDAAWFIHHDADEFREGPWADLDLSASIQRVDRFGYNAIDFELLNFWPTHDHFEPGQDVRDVFTHYERSEPWNKTQIRCWKKAAGPVDLASTGGHEAIFAGRRIFPIRFILRHYPIRGQAHGARKVFQERSPRFIGEERARGWHVQYKQFEPGESFIRDAATLIPYDPDLVRLNLALHHRRVEELEALPETAEREGDQAKRYAARVDQELDERNKENERLEQELDARNRRIEALGRAAHERNLEVETLRQQLTADSRGVDIEQLEREADRRNRQIERLEREADRRNRKVERLERDLDARNHLALALEAALAQITNSRSWRWTKFLRRLEHLVRGQIGDE